MSNSIQGMKLFYDVKRMAEKNGCQLSDETLKELIIGLMPDKSVQERLDRAKTGYAAEELFSVIYSQLPWVKLVVPLVQEQYPKESKKTIQVPDYEVHFEAGSNTKIEKILVEVKLVSGDKKTLNIPKYKYEVLHQYENNTNIPLVFGVYWQKYDTWTLNTINAFYPKKSEYKITYQEAYESDLSAILGDYMYLFKKQFYRKSLYKTKNEVTHNEQMQYPYYHEDYGYPYYEGISYSTQKYDQLNFLEVSILDSSFDFEKIKEEKEINKICLIEKLDNKEYCYKLSQLLSRFLAKVYLYDNEKISFNGSIVTDYAFGIVDTLRQKICGTKHYLIPNDNSETAQKLMQIQFNEVPHIHELYSHGAKTKGYLLLANHENVK